MLLALYAVANTVLIDRYPRVWVDEAWESITGHVLAHEARLRNPILPGQARFDVAFVQPRILQSILLAPVFGIAGTGHVQGRLLSVAAGAVLLLFVYLLCHQFWSPRVALAAVWLTMIDTIVFISARTIRPEIFLTALELACLYFFFLALDRRSNRHGLIGGILLGIAFWTHPNALLIACALAVVLLIEFGASLVKEKLTWFILVGFAAGILPFLVYLLTRDVADPIAMFWRQLGERPGAISQQGWLGVSVQGEWQRFVELYRFPQRLFIGACYFGAWILAFRARDRFIRRIALILLVEGLLSFLIILNKSVLYATTIVPLVCILAAYLFDQTVHPAFQLRAPKTSSPRLPFTKSHAALLLALAVSLNQIAGNVYLLWTNRDCSYNDLSQKLQTAIPPHSSVWGSMAFWFALQDHPYRTQYTTAEDLTTFKPEYIIAGDRETWGEKPSWEPVRRRVEEIVQRQGGLVASIDDRCYGHLRLYRIHWD